MSGKVPVIYTGPHKGLNKVTAMIAKYLKSIQETHPPGVSSSRGGKRRTMKRKGMRRKTHKRRRC